MTVHTTFEPQFSEKQDNRKPNHERVYILGTMGMSGHAEPEAVLGVTITFTIIAVFAVALRLYSRIFLVHSPGKDDVFIIGACAMTICLTVAQGYQGMFRRSSEDLLYQS